MASGSYGRNLLYRRGKQNPLPTRQGGFLTCVRRTSSMLTLSDFFDQEMSGDA